MIGCERHGAWTLVELLVAMVSAAVLALTVGAMLVFTFGAWQRHLGLADMQADMRVTVPALCSAIREGRASEVREPLVGATGARLTVGKRSFFRANSGLSYDGAGTWLACDPDTNVVNNTMALCRGGVTAFQCTCNSNSITFHLGLQQQSETMVIDEEAFFRN